MREKGGKEKSLSDEANALRLFLSHASCDHDMAKNLERAIFHAFKLRRKHVEIFVAERSIASSVRWEEAIAEAIGVSDGMLVLWTPHSGQANGQLIEIGAGWILGKPLLPILLDCTFGDLDPVILRRRQAVSWRDFVDAPFRHLEMVPRSGSGA